MKRVAAALALGLLLTACAGAPGLNDRTTPADKPSVTATSKSTTKAPPPVEGVVVYKIGGTATKALSVSWAGKGLAIAQAADAKLPWKKAIDFGSENILASLVAQNAGSGTISCSISINGEVVSSNESTGQYAVVSCNASA